MLEKHFGISTLSLKWSFENRKAFPGDVMTESKDGMQTHTIDNIRMSELPITEMVLFIYINMNYSTPNTTPPDIV